MSQNCAGGTLAAFVPDSNKPWNATRVTHLYRRIAFGGSHTAVQAGLQMSTSDLVDALIDSAKTAPFSPAPSWYNWTYSNYTDFPTENFTQIKDWYLHWVSEMLVTGVREKMALFWHNHFVTRFVDYQCASYLYEYHKLLQTHPYGNFKTFLKEMAKTPAMLSFLDGRLNKKTRPNENYARELFELFTLGVNNGYTQQDITEAARALTGWTGITEECAPVAFKPSDFDNTNKTVFGQTSNFDFDGVHDLIFTERAMETSQFICSKIYKNFVHPIPNQTIIDGMAQTFRDNNFDIEPVFKELFKSEHFYENDVMGVVVKSPVEFLIMMINEGNLPYDQNIIDFTGYLTADMGQQLFNPIDVSGWNGNRAWINSTAITTRWNALSQYLDYLYVTLDNEKLRQLAVDIVGSSNDVALVAKKVTDHFIPKGIDAAGYAEATVALKYQVPDNYFTGGLWNLSFQYVPAQMWNLLKWILRRPEFQLM